MQTVPFGFEATGEFGLLLKERRIRAALREQCARDAEARPPVGWDPDDESDADTDATEDYHPGEKDVGEEAEGEEDKVD